jgi:uracil-DNA glycosylase family 4
VKTEIVKDIKGILLFYQALGFDALPISFEAVKRIYGEKKNDSRVVDSPATPGFIKSKEASLKALREEIGDCRRCKLAAGRKNIVFGEGNPDARLMFVGEGPGREEDLQARPFVGDAGMLLTRLIEKMGFKREEVYIANIVKCRPPMNRDPERDEIESCRGFVERQIEIISPTVIISLGRISSQTLLGNATLKMTAVRGHFFDYRGIPLMPTFHPAYLRRNPKDKWLTWSDAQMVLDKLRDTEEQEKGERTTEA